MTDEAMRGAGLRTQRLGTPGERLMEQAGYAIAADPRVVDTLMVVRLPYHLSAVTQAAELLRDEKRSEMQGRLVRIINDNAQRIERMIRDVLALGRR